MTTPTDRSIAARIDRLEQETDTCATRAPVELTAEQRSQIEAIIASLDAEQRDRLTACQARIAEEPDDAPTGAFGLTAAEADYLDILTGGEP